MYRSIFAQSLRLLKIGVTRSTVREGSEECNICHISNTDIHDSYNNCEQISYHTHVSFTFMSVARCVNKINDVIPVTCKHHVTTIPDPDLDRCDNITHLLGVQNKVSVHRQL